MSLAGNWKASCRDPNKKFKEHKDALPPELLSQLKRVLHHHKPTTFVVHVMVEQHRQAHAYGNHSLVPNDIPKVESTLSKEERNKHVAL